MNDSYTSIEELSAAYRARSVSPVEVMTATLDAADRLNPLCNAFRVIDRPGALLAARESEARWHLGAPLGRLDGVPLSVKDNLMVKGFAFRSGSMATSDVPVTESAPVVDLAQREGACIFGITTMPEFGTGAVTISPLTGITRNPWDLQKNSGGSSGGAAASTAAQVGYGALVTDAGGSARIPAALCGVPGFKPTGGTFPAYPPSMVGTIASPGVIARTVADVALISDVLANADPRDTEMLPPPSMGLHISLDTLRQQIEKNPRSIRIAFTTTMGYSTRVDPQIARLIERAAGHFERLGFAVDEAHPDVGNPVDDFVTIFGAGTAYSLGRLGAEQRERLGDPMKRAVAAGETVTMQQYLAAHDVRRATARAMQTFHQTYALLLSPTCAITAFDAVLWYPPGYQAHESRAWTPFTSLFNLAQQPAISVPCGLTSERLPVGLQIAGPRFADASVLSAAQWFASTWSESPGSAPVFEREIAK